MNARYISHCFQVVPMLPAADDGVALTRLNAVRRPACGSRTARAVEDLRRYCAGRTQSFWPFNPARSCTRDRYANIEADYLPWRMKSHRGLTTLTTNSKRRIDEALLCRARLIEEFPFPDVLQRRDVARSPSSASDRSRPDWAAMTQAGAGLCQDQRR